MATLLHSDDHISPEPPYQYWVVDKTHTKLKIESCGPVLAPAPIRRSTASYLGMS